MVKGLENLSAMVDSKKFTAHAQAILASESSRPNVSKHSVKDKKVSYRLKSLISIRYILIVKALFTGSMLALLLLSFLVEVCMLFVRSFFTS